MVKVKNIYRERINMWWLRNEICQVTIKRWFQAWLGQHLISFIRLRKVWEPRDVIISSLERTFWDTGWLSMLKYRGKALLASGMVRLTFWWKYLGHIKVINSSCSVSVFCNASPDYTLGFCVGLPIETLIHAKANTLHCVTVLSLMVKLIS